MSELSDGDNLPYMFPQSKYVLHFRCIEFALLVTFSHSCMFDKVLFWGRIFEAEILLTL